MTRVGDGSPIDVWTKSSDIAVASPEFAAEQHKHSLKPILAMVKSCKIIFGQSCGQSVMTKIRA